MGDLAVRDLAVEYHSGTEVVRPLDGFTMDAGTGQLVLLLGPSGCGKTSLLSCLGGILSPAAGSVRFAGTEVTDLRGPELTRYRRSTVGIMFQAYNLVLSLTAAENVAAPLWGAGVARRAAAARAAELLERMGLSAVARRRPGQLSGGQQQRVAIARALAHNPPLLLADEPTAHLDAAHVEGVLRLLRELAAPGRLVVIATHDDRLLPLADAVVRLTEGPAEPVVESQTFVLRKGDVLFAQGDPGALVFVVDEGRIELVVAADGEEHVVQVAGPAGYFGELAPLLGMPRSATARARSNAVVTGYSLTAFRERLGSGPLPETWGRLAAGVRSARGVTRRTPTPPDRREVPGPVRSR